MTLVNNIQTPKAYYKQIIDKVNEYKRIAYVGITSPAKEEKIPALPAFLIDAYNSNITAERRSSGNNLYTLNGDIECFLLTDASFTDDYINELFEAVFEKMAELNWGLTFKQIMQYGYPALVVNGRSVAVDVVQITIELKKMVNT